MMDTHIRMNVFMNGGPYVNLRVLWCKTYGNVIKYYIDGDGNKVTLEEFNVEKENENGIQKRCDK